MQLQLFVTDATAPYREDKKKYIQTAGRQHTTVSISLIQWRCLMTNFSIGASSNGSCRFTIPFRCRALPEIGPSRPPVCAPARRHREYVERTHMFISLIAGSCRAGFEARQWGRWFLDMQVCMRRRSSQPLGHDTVFTGRQARSDWGCMQRGRRSSSGSSSFASELASAPSWVGSDRKRSRRWAA